MTVDPEGYDGAPISARPHQTLLGVRREAEGGAGDVAGAGGRADAGGDVDDLNRAAAGAAHHQVVVPGEELGGEQLVPAHRHTPQQLPGRQLPQVQRPVLTAAHQQLVARRDVEVRDPAGVAVQGAGDHVLLQVEHGDGAVQGAGHQLVVLVVREHELCDRGPVGVRHVVQAPKVVDLGARWTRQGHGHTPTQQPYINI